MNPRTLAEIEERSRETHAAANRRRPEADGAPVEVGPKPRLLAPAGVGVSRDQAAILRAMPRSRMTAGEVWHHIPTTVRLRVVFAELNRMREAGWVTREVSRDDYVAWVRRSPVTLWTRTPAGAEALVEFERVGVKCPA